MAFPDAAWPCGDDDLDVHLYSLEKGYVNWDISNFLLECREGERKKLKSDSFAFGGAMWNLFASFDGRKGHSLFGINIRGLMPSDSVLHCYCEIKFESTSQETKNMIFKFECLSADSHCAVEEFLSDSELNMFLQDGYQIECDISIKRYKKNDSSKSFAAKAHKKSRFPENYPSAFPFYLKPFTYSPAASPKFFPQSRWSFGGDDLKVSICTPEEGCVIWEIKSFLPGCLAGKKELRSEDFSFDFVKWNLFASFDKRNTRSLLGISVRQNDRQSLRMFDKSSTKSLDTGLDCYCTITFKETTLKTITHIVFKFKCESIDSQCTLEDFLPITELIDFLTLGAHIVCRFYVKKYSVEAASPQAESSNSSRRNTFKDHTETQLQDNPTASAPQSDSRSQPSGSVRSSATLPSPPVLPTVTVLPTLTGGDYAYPMGRNGEGGGFQGNNSYSASAPQSNSGWKSPRSRQRSLKALLCGSPGLSKDRRSRRFPGKLDRDPSEGYRGSIPLGGAGGMPSVPGGDYGDPLGKDGRPSGIGEFQGNNNYSMWPYPDYFWPQLGGFHIESISIGEVKVTWDCGDLYDFSEWFPERMALRSDSFPLVGATWNLFASFDRNNVCSLFGINVKERMPPHAVLACDCDINFSYLLNGVCVPKNIKSNFRFESCHTHWKKRDFLSKVELGKVFQTGSYITCRILVKELNNEGAKITHSSSSGKDQLLPDPTASAPQSDSGSQPSGSARSSAVLPPYGGLFSILGVPKGDYGDLIDGPGGRDELKKNIKDGEELPMVKVFKDFKNLLQSGEGADVTLQVQDQQFKAHRIIITARSSVFAAMIQNDMQENATGVVNVEDCDPASFPVLLEFLYCGGTEQLSVENVFSLYKSADKYDVQDLKMRCLQFIKHNLSVETFCETLRISFEHPETNLLTVATEFFIRHFKQISSTSEWETFLSENPVKGNKLFMETAKIKFQ